MKINDCHLLGWRSDILKLYYTKPERLICGQHDLIINVHLILATYLPPILECWDWSRCISLTPKLIYLHSFFQEHQKQAHSINILLTLCSTPALQNAPSTIISALDETTCACDSRHIGQINSSRTRASSTQRLAIPRLGPFPSVYPRQKITVSSRKSSRKMAHAVSNASEERDYYVRM